jgi:hypothetical protein
MNATQDSHAAHFKFWNNKDYPFKEDYAKFNSFQKGRLVYPNCHPPGGRNVLESVLTDMQSQKKNLPARLTLALPSLRLRGELIPHRRSEQNQRFKEESGHNFNRASRKYQKPTAG